mmetsp:Transcript_42090/g.95110  ORF Transcript_42090/g.95110 Transcript_42090/m.95110 type:complete len:268 (+) Transcript_42090:634-1437(+)
MLRGVKPRLIRDLSVGQGGDALARLGVEVAHETVERGGQKVAPVVCEVHVPHPHGVPRVSSLHRPRVVGIPNLHLPVVGSGEEEVARVGEPADRLHALGVPRVPVDQLLGQVAVVHLVLLRGEGPGALGRLDPAATLVVVLRTLGAVEHRARLRGLGVFGVPRRKQMRELSLVPAVEVVVLVEVLPLEAPLLGLGLLLGLVLRLDRLEQLHVVVPVLDPGSAHVGVGPELELPRRLRPCRLHHRVLVSETLLLLLLLAGPGGNANNS